MCSTGAHFAIETLFISKTGTGTGQIDIAVITVDDFPYGYDDLIQSVPPGGYNITITDQATTSGCGDNPCEQWLPGNYTIVVSKSKRIWLHCVAFHTRVD